MTRSAFCTTCSRTVYVEFDNSLVCPVCSSPILEAIGPEQGLPPDPAGNQESKPEAQSSERK